MSLQISNRNKLAAALGALVFCVADLVLMKTGFWAGAD